MPGFQPSVIADESNSDTKTRESSENESKEAGASGEESNSVLELWFASQAKSSSRVTDYGGKSIFPQTEEPRSHSAPRVASPAFKWTISPAQKNRSYQVTRKVKGKHPSAPKASTAMRQESTEESLKRPTSQYFTPPQTPNPSQPPSRSTSRHHKNGGPTKPPIHDDSVRPLPRPRPQTVRNGESPASHFMPSPPSSSRQSVISFMGEPLQGFGATRSRLMPQQSTLSLAMSMMNPSPPGMASPEGGAWSRGREELLGSSESVNHFRM